MDDKHKAIPELSSEDEERDFWATNDSTEYIDWNKAERNPALSRLKPSTRDKNLFDVDQINVLH